MKRNYLFKNTVRLSLVIGLVAATLLSSCLKDKSPGTIDFSKSPALIGWQYKGGSATPYVAAVLPNAGSTYTIELTLSVASLTLSSPVTATVIEDDASLPAGFVPLPTSLYTLPNSGKVTIAAGQQIIKYVITFQGDQIDFSQGYALALKLTSPNGAIVASNLSTAVIELKLKSQYEDTYNVISGATTRYAGGAENPVNLVDQFAVTESTLLYSTLTANSITGQAGSSAFGLSAEITITGTTVVVSADPTNPGATFNYINGNNAGQSSYDPATKTLTLHYKYLNAAGNLRVVNMVLVGQ